MISKNKWKILLSSLIIVLPAIAALVLKDNVDNGLMGAWYFTWIMPLFLVLVHLFAIFFTLRDNFARGQSEKIINIIFWIIPTISVFSCGIFMMISFGVVSGVSVFVPLLLGLGFVAMGNIMPKATRNRTFGIKIKWTLANDDNWAATHRFSGKLWVVCGILTMLLCFFPFDISMFLIIAILLLAVIPPAVYSYLFYKRQIAEGKATKDDYDNYPRSESDKKATVATLISLGVILVLVAVLMFVGSISFELGDESMKIGTTFGGGVTLDYSDIESVELREDGVDGMRVSGFASSKLLFGIFTNDELGSYTRYTYTGKGPAIIIKTADGILVIADETPELTESLYDSLSERINE